MPTLTPALREIVYKVRQHPSVDNVSIGYRAIRVKFKDGITESWKLRPGKNWWYTYDLPSKKWFKRDIKASNLYESSMFDDEWNRLIAPHFVINRKMITGAGFCDLRLRIHSLVLSLVEEGWIDIKHPEQTVIDDFKGVVEANREPVILSPYWIRHWVPRAVPPGMLIMYQCTSWGDLSSLTLREAWKDHTLLFRAIKSLADKKKPITRDSIIRRMSRSGVGSRFASPVFYSAVIKDLFKSTSILDVNPDIGSKAMGARAMGVKYYYIDNGVLTKSISKYTGDLLPHDGSKVDLVILNDMYDKTLDWVPKVNEYRKYGKTTIAFFRKEHLSAVKADKTIRCTVKPGKHDYLAIYYS